MDLVTYLQMSLNALTGIHGLRDVPLVTWGGTALTLS